MNKIFKVVWSKSKQCYVVVSEIAKNTTGKKKIIVASILAGLAMLTSGGVSNVVAVAPIPPVDRPSQGVANGSVKPGTTNGVAIGSSSYIDSNQSIAIGYRSYASGTFLGGNIKPSLAIGAGADARGNNTISIGTVANNAASYAVALGNESNVGSGADYGVAVGYGSSVSAQQGIAIGTNTKSTSSLAMAIGNGAQASGENAISIGRTTSASGGDAVSIGTSSQATGGDAVSIGSSSQATGGDSIALGKSAKAKNGDTIAIGQDAEASLLNAVALGKTSKATGASATALGPQSTASATFATAIGMSSVASQEYAIAIGGGSEATVARGVALGTYSKADTASGVSGYDANANRTNKYAGLTGNTLTSSWGAVSIGDGTNTRQMTGLAAGTKDTDAVNVAQLKSVNLAVTGDNSSSGDVNLANSKLAVTGDTTYVTTTAANQGITVKGVKKDITVSNGTASANAGMADAKNVAEAINQANADQKITYKANGSTANSVKLSDGLNFTNGTSTVATVGTNGQVTYDLNAGTKKSIDDSQAAVKRTISLGADSGTRSSQSLNNSNVDFNIKGASGSYITTSMVGNTVTINTTKGTIQSDAAGMASLSGADGLATAQNVATAINKAKEGSAWNLAVNTGAAQKVSGGTKVTLQNGNNIALTQTGTTITVGTTSQLTADAVTVGSGTNQIVLNGTTGEVSGKSIKTGNSTLNTNGLTISGGPSVTSTGINAGNKVISGVSQGVAGNDAVNKSQMDAAIKTVADSTNELGKNTVTLAAQSGSTTGQALNSATGIKFYINGESGSDALISTSASGTNVSVASTQKLKDAVTQAANAANKDLSNLSTAGDTHIKDLAKTAATWNVSTNGSNNTAVAGGETVNFVNGDNVAITNTGRNITIGTAKNVSFDKVTLGGITIDKTDGINAGGKEIKGIADATAADSAVSKGQMDTAIANAQTAATSTEKVVAKTLTGDNNLATVTGQTGTAKNETYEVAVSENAVKAVAVNAAQDAVKVAGTGLATVSDATAAGVKTYTVNVEEGKLVLDDATGNVGAAGSTQGTTAGKDGVATTQNVAKAINEAVTKANANNAQALADAEHKFDGDTGTTSVRKHGEVLSIKGGVTTPADLTTGNIGVVSDGAGTLNVRLAKALTGLTSATYTDGAGNTQTVTGASSTITDGAGNTTSMTKGGLSTTDGTNTTTVASTGVTATDGTHTVKVEGSGIDAGNTEIKNVAAGTTNTSAVNKKQMDDAISKATGDATHEFGGDDTTVVSRKHGEQLNIKGGASTTAADLTDGNIAVLGDATTGTLNLKLAKALTGLTSATYTDAAGNTTTVTGGSTTIADAAGNTQTLAPTKSEIKDAAGVSTVTTKDGVTATDAAGNTTALTNGGVRTTDGAGNTTALTKGGLSTTDGTNTTTVTPNGMTATDGTNTVKVNGSGIDAGNTEIKNVAAGTTNTSAVNKKQMDDAINKATGDATHEFGGDDTTVVSRKHGEQLNIKGGASTTAADLTDGNIAVLGDATTGTLNLKLAKALTGLTSATYTDAAGNTTTVTGGTTTIADAAGNTQTLAPTKSEIKDAAGVSTVTTKDGVTATDAAGNTTALTNGGVSTTDGAGNTTALTKGGLSTTDGTNTTTVAPTGVTATDGTHTVKVEGSGIDAGNTEIKNVAAGTTNTSAVNKKQMDDAISKATGDATHEFGGDDTTVVSRKHGEQLNIKGGASTTAADLTDGNIAVLGDATTGTLNLKLAKALTGLTSATYTDAAGNTTTVTGGSTTIADAAGNTQTLAPTKSEIKDAAGVSTVTTKDGVTTTDAAGNTTALTKGGLSTKDGTNTTTVAPTGVTATDGTHTVKVEGSGIDAGNTEIKNVAAGTTATSAVNKKQMEDAVKAGGTWKVTTNTGATTEVTGGDTVDFINGENIAITNTGRNITIGTAKTVSFDKVTVGGITIDKTDGINAGGKEIKGIADATAADSAVSKGQMDTAIANAQTAATSTEKVVAKTLTGDNNLATVTGQTGTAKNETYEVAVSENAVKAVAVNAAQDAVKVAGTGLATVSDATAGGVKTYTVNVEEGKLVLDDATGNIGAAGSTQGTTTGKNGVATTQNVAKAINEAVTKANTNNAQALADAEHKFDGDTGTTSVRKHGEVLSIKGGVTTPADLTTGNIGVVSDGAGTLNVRLAKVLTGLTSATYTDAAGNTTTVTGGSTTIADAAGNTQTLVPTKSEIKDAAGVSTVTTKDGVTATDGAGNATALTKGGLSTTDGTNTTTVTPNGMTATDGTNTVKVNGSGIDAGNTEIKNVAAGTTNTSAVNKKQMDDAINKATGDATHEFGGDDTTVVSRKHGEQLNIKGGASTTAADLTDGNIAVLGDATTGTLNLKLAKALTGLTSATYTDAAGNTTTVTGGSTTIADAAGNTQTLVPTKSEIKDNAGVSTVTTKDGVTATDAAGNTTALTNGGVSTTDGAGNTTALTKGGLSTTDGTNTTTVTPNGMTATDGTNTVKVNGSGIDAGNTEIKNVAAGTTNTSAVNKKQMDDAINKATGDATHEFGGDDTTVVSRKHGEQLNIKGGASTTAADLTDGNIAVLGDATTGTLNLKLAKALTGLTSATYTDAAGNTTTVTGGSTTIADAAGNTQTLAPTKSEIKDNAGVSTVTTKDGVTAKDAAGNTTALTKGGLSTTDGTNTTTVTPNGMTATDGTNTVKVEGTGIDAGNTEIKNVAAGTTNTSAVNKKQMDDAINKATGDATHEFGGDDTTVVSRKHGEQLNIKGGASTTAADLTDGNIAVLGDATTGTLNLKLAKALTGLTSATYTDAAGNTTTVTGGSTTIADAAGNTQTLAPTKSEIKDNAGVSTVTTKDGVTAKDAAGNTTALTKGGLSTTDGTNTTTVTPNGMTATDGTNTVKVEGTGIDAGNTEIKNVAAGTTNTSAVNKKQMDDAINKATGDATHEFGGDDTTVVSRKHGEQLNIKGGASTTAADLTDGNIAVLGDATTGTLNLKLAKALTGLTSATYTDAAGNTTTVTGGSTTIADAAGNTQTLAPTKSEIKDNAGGSTVTTKDGVTATDAAGNTTALTNGGVRTTDGAGNTTALTKGGLSTTDGTNTTTVTPNGMTATDGTNTVKVEGSGIDAGNTEIKNVAAGTTNTSAVNKKQMDDAISKATGDATHEFGGDDTTVVSRKHGEQLNIKGGASTTAADLTDGNIAVLGDATTGTLNLKLAKALTGLTSATYTDAAGKTTTVTGGSTTIADAAGNTQTLAPTKSEIKDAAGVSTVTTKDGVTATDAAGNTAALTKDGVTATDAAGNTTVLTNGGVSTTDGAGNTTALTKGGLSTTDGTNTTTVTPNGMTATDGTNTVKVEGSGIDAGNTEIKNVAAGTTATSAVNKGQMDDAISKATADATHEFGGDTGNTSVRKHGEVLSIKGGITDTTKLSDNNIGVVSDGAGTLNVKLAKDLIGLNSATYTDAAGNTTTVTGGTTTIADAAGNTQTLAPTKSEIKDAAGVSTVTTKDGVTATDAAGNTTALTKGGLSTTDAAGNTTALTNGGVSTTDGAGNTTALTKGGLSTTDGTNTTTVTPNGLTATDGTNIVKVNGSGIDAGNTEIKNVADGTTPNSAVNKNQLDTAVNRLQNATDNISLNIAGNNGTGNIKLKDQVLHIDGTNGLTTKANGQSVTVGLDDATMSTINNTAALANNAAKKDLSNIDQAGKEVIKDTAAWHVKVNSMAPEIVKGGDTVTFNDGHNITITNTGKDITVATKKEVTFDKVSVGGITIDKQADHISGVSSITGSGSGAPTMTFNASNGSTPSSVSMDSNLDMGGKQINNVAAATRPTDAVNKQQVDQAMKSLAGMADSAAKKYASKAGANAAALAALKPIQYDPLAPTQIMAGIGNYKSQTAVALGVAHYTNEDTMFNIGASLDSQDAMLNAGVTHKFGSSSERKNIPDRYKGGPISSIYVMQDEVSALKAQNSEMQAMLDKQSSENAAIIAENKMLREQNEEMQRKVDLILSKLQ